MKDRIVQLKKDCIIEVATSHFTKNDYENTKVSDIAKETGVSISTIYDFFENKEGLYKAAISTKIKEFHTELLEFDKTKGNPKEKLEKYIEMKFSLTIKHKENMLELYHNTPWFFSKMVVNESLEETEKLLSSFFEGLDKDEPLREKNFDLLALTFMHYLEAYTDLFLRDKYDLSSKSPQILLSEFLNGVKK